MFVIVYEIGPMDVQRKLCLGKKFPHRTQNFAELFKPLFFKRATIVVAKVKVSNRCRPFFR